MNGEGPPGPFADIPILLEPVVDAGGAAHGQAPHAAQQALFADLPEPAARRDSTSRARTAQARTTAALAELNRRAPAVVEGLIEAHAGLLKGLLRERLQAELAEILRELPEDPPATS